MSSQGMYVRRITALIGTEFFVANGAIKAFIRFDTGLWRYPEERREACLRVKIDRKGPIAMQGEVLR